ncbi:hypothetical protein ACP275_02G093100 [Erythranthe tilingii]
MAESSSVSNNPDGNSDLSRKRRKIEPEHSAAAGGVPTETGGPPKWRTEVEQQIYSSKLIDALRHLRRPESAKATSSAVRDAADRVLASSARGKTRWSRAILTRRLSLRLAHINKKHRRVAKPAAADFRRNKPAVRDELPPLRRKVKALSRLVPGCRKLKLPNLLEETTDYIAALEMQVKALTFITALLNGGGTVTATAAAAGSS